MTDHVGLCQIRARGGENVLGRKCGQARVLVAVALVDDAVRVADEIAVAADGIRIVRAICQCLPLGGAHEIRIEPFGKLRIHRVLENLLRFRARVPGIEHDEHVHESAAQLRIGVCFDGQRHVRFDE